MGRRKRRPGELWKSGPSCYAPCDVRRHIRNIRLTDRDLNVLKNYAAIIERDTGQRPSDSWVMRELWILGVASFEDRHLRHVDLVGAVQETMFEEEFEEEENE